MITFFHWDLIAILPTYFMSLVHHFHNIKTYKIAAILTNEVAWFDMDENNTGSLTAKLAADATLVRSALADRLSTIVQNVALTVTAFAIAFTLSWKLTAVVAACLPLLIGASITEVSTISSYEPCFNL